MIENINWYPGHMKKTREMISENLKMVDIVVEVIDSRIPVSSRNPIIDELTGGKKRIIILNKSDLADAGENSRWAESFAKQGNLALAMNCMEILKFYEIPVWGKKAVVIGRSMNAITCVEFRVLFKNVRIVYEGIAFILAHLLDSCIEFLIVLKSMVCRNCRFSGNANGVDIYVSARRSLVELRQH